MKKLILILAITFSGMILQAQTYKYSTLHTYTLKNGMEEYDMGWFKEATVTYGSYSVLLGIPNPSLKMTYPISKTLTRGSTNRTTYISDTYKVMIYNHFNGKYTVWILGAGDAMYILSNESDATVQRFYRENYKKIMDHYSK